MKQIGDKLVFLWILRENKRTRRDSTQRVSRYDGAMAVRYVKG